MTPLLPDLALSLGSSVSQFRSGLLSRNRVWVSLPIPLVTVSRFLLSNLPTHSPSSVHTPITLFVGPLPSSCTLVVMARRTFGLCCTGGCHSSQHHVHDCSLALRLSHSISPGGFLTGTLCSAPCSTICCHFVPCSSAGSQWTGSILRVV